MGDGTSWLGPIVTLECEVYSEPHALLIILSLTEMSLLHVRWCEMRPVVVCFHEMNYGEEGSGKIFTHQDRTLLQRQPCPYRSDSPR